jgi:hypothetical protein
MLRLLQGDPNPVKVPPRSTLIRQGLEIRWTKGEAYVWLGVQKQTGRGERSSGLAFDTIVNAPKASS